MFEKDCIGKSSVDLHGTVFFYTINPLISIFKKEISK